MTTAALLTWKDLLREAGPKWKDNIAVQLRSRSDQRRQTLGTHEVERRLDRLKSTIYCSFAYFLALRPCLSTIKTYLAPVTVRIYSYFARGESQSNSCNSTGVICNTDVVLLPIIAAAALANDDKYVGNEAWN